MELNRSNATGTKPVAPFAKHLNTHVCPKQMRTATGKEAVSFLSDGKLFVDNKTHQLIFAKGFCVENFYYLGANGDEFRLHLSAFLCITEQPIVTVKKKKAANAGVCSNNDLDLNKMSQHLRFWLTVAGLVSLVFLLFTLYFYSALPDLRNFQGIIICAYIMSIILTTSLLIVIYNVRIQELKVEEEEGELREEYFLAISGSTCRLIGYSFYFAGILMFCWMSVLCFDLFWTFVCTPVQLQNKKNNGRLLVYFLIGIGVPVLMTLLVFLIDRFKWAKVRPGVGRYGCFLTPIGARYYFNIPILVLLAFNTVIFVITTYSLWSSFRQNKLASSHQSSQRRKVSEEFIS